LPNKVLSQFNTLMLADSPKSNIESFWKALIEFNVRGRVRNNNHDGCEQGFHKLISYWSNATDSPPLTANANIHYNNIELCIQPPGMIKSKVDCLIFETQKGLLGVGPVGYTNSDTSASESGILLRWSQALAGQSYGDYLMVIVSH
jgi:hypothetical protein